MNHLDAIVIGAGAAGMHCAATAGQRGLRVLLVDHATKIGEKIRISGGGRCNFTNVDASRPERFITEQPRFARDVLRAYRPEAFIALVRAYGIAYHEKHKGQLFCDRSAEDIVSLLRSECDKAKVQWRCGQSVDAVRADQSMWQVIVGGERLQARSVVIATGGPSIPKIGATDWGQRLAQRLGHRIVPLRPALVPLTFAQEQWPFAGLAGLALPVGIEAGEGALQCHFDEDLLFTHRGLSGPAVLQASSYWLPGQALRLNLSAGHNIEALLTEARAQSRQLTASVLAQLLPKRLVETWLAQSPVAKLSQRKVAELGNKDIAAIAQTLRCWTVQPDGSEGYRKAEVTAGGVATDELDARSMQSLRHPGLYFIGEVVDVTGWLGGYNFQWAWASAAVAGRALSVSGPDT
jgi:predicted Rossmann fold flavoprotein